MKNKLEKFRNIEPLSRVLRAFGIPPIEVIKPQPVDIFRHLGLPILEEELPKIKEEFLKSIEDD